MIDCSDTETAAIRSAYGLAVLILECLWHVLKAVTEQAKKKLKVEKPPPGVSKVEANRQLRDAAKKDFVRLVYAASEEEFDVVWEEIKSLYGENKEWIQYLTGEWLGKKEKWSMPWRKVCCLGQ